MPFGAFAMPVIPPGLMHDMIEIAATKKFDQASGGQHVPAGKDKIRFKGVVMPVGDEDLQYLEGGTVTQFTEKVYTNGHALTVGAQVYDPQDRRTYTVKQQLGHNSIHPIKRYLVEAKGESGARV